LSLSTCPSPSPNYTLSLHDALPISDPRMVVPVADRGERGPPLRDASPPAPARDAEGTSVQPPCPLPLALSLRHGHREVVGRVRRSEEHTSELQSRGHLVCRLLLEKK